MLSFKSKDLFVVRGRGTAFVVKNDIDRKKGEDGLTGTVVKIDDKKYFVTAIEDDLISSFHKKNTLIVYL